jgi:hypothetical protein
MLQDTEEMIALKIVCGRCSRGFVREIDDHYENRTLHVHIILDEIAALEGVAAAKPSNMQQEKPFDRHPLQGLWHKHFMQPAYIGKNLENHWTPKRSKRLEQLIRDVPPDRWAYDFVIEGYSRRAGNAPPSEGLQPALTGEWIVFARHQGLNYYLTLGRHGEDEEIWKRCRACAPDFPELSILQEDRLS